MTPIGTSTRPVLLSLPASEKTLVPGLSAVPSERYQSTPRSTIGATFAQVSTLLMLVGLPHRPDAAG